MALPAVQQAQAAPQIIYDWDRNLYLVALVHGSCAYYFPICPGMFAPGPQYRLHSEPSRETVMTDIPPPAIAEYCFGSDYEENDSLMATSELDSDYVDYPYDYGRRYNAYQEGEYWAPNDDIQQNQMNIAHDLFHHLLEGKLVEAPIPEDIREVVDLGAGNGKWAVDFADEHLSANVIGIDFSAIQPNEIPVNCNFIVDDVCAKWFYPLDHFDLVHIRQLYGSIADWSDAIDSLLPFFLAISHLKPGGWIDQQEMSVEFKCDDGSLPYDHPLRRWSRLMLQAGEISGKTFRVVNQARNYLLGAGFVDINEKRHKVPVGTWPAESKMKALGSLNLEQIKAGIDGWTIMPFMRDLRWSYVDMRNLLRDVFKAFEDPDVHAYIEVVSFCARKPDKGETSGSGLA